MLYTLYAHSGLRWLVLLFLVVAIFKSLSGWLGKKSFNKSDNLVALLLLSFTHIQLIVGFILYFWNGWMSNIAETMKNSNDRFWSVEHITFMILAVVLITIGRVKSKKASTDELKHKKSVIFYGIAFFLILWAGLVKPFLLERGWF